MSDKKQEDLDHGLIMLAMKEMAADISINFEKVESNLNSLRVKHDAEREAAGIQLEAILTEAKKTNGRITKLENDTDIIRFFKKYKWVLPLCAVGLWAIYNFLEYEQVLRLIKRVF